MLATPPDLMPKTSSPHTHSPVAQGSSHLLCKSHDESILSKSREGVFFELAETGPAICHQEFKARLSSGGMHQNSTCCLNAHGQFCTSALRDTMLCFSLTSREPGVGRSHSAECQLGQGGTSLIVGALVAGNAWKAHEAVTLRA